MLDTDPAPPGRFQPGQSGNPAGRPRGSRNKATMAAEALFDGAAEALTERLVAEGRSGNMAALRICFDRLVPRRKGRPVTFALPRITSHCDAVDAAAAIVAGVAEGELTPPEGIDLMRLIEVFARVRAIRDLEHRLAAVEQALAAAPVKTHESTDDVARENADAATPPNRPQTSPEPAAPATTDEFTGDASPYQAPPPDRRHRSAVEASLMGLVARVNHVRDVLSSYETALRSSSLRATHAPRGPPR